MRRPKSGKKVVQVDEGYGVVLRGRGDRGD